MNLFFQDINIKDKFKILDVDNEFYRNHEMNDLQLDYSISCTG